MESISVGVRSGCFCAIGGRDYQEDRIVVQSNLCGFENFYAAVYDGHGGDEVSSYLSRTFHGDFKEHPKFKTLPISALQAVWAGMDEKCYNMLNQSDNDGSKRNTLSLAGSTATVCYITGTDFYLTNCGDSSAYCVMEDGTAEKITEDHGTTNLEEIKRCEAAGGEVKYEMRTVKVCCREKTVAAGDKPRVYPGGLLVTRAFGDFYAKREFLGGKPNVVIAEHGRIAYKNLQKKRAKYIVLASDGVWDVLTIKDVMEIIEKSAITQHQSIALKSNKVHPISTSPTLLSEGGEGMHSKEVESQVGQLIEAGHVVADIDHLNIELCTLARQVVDTAVTSKKWIDMNAKADNTCCVLIKLDYHAVGTSFTAHNGASIDKDASTGNSSPH